MMTKPLKTYADMTERQKAACHALGDKFGVTLDTIAGHLTAFMDLSAGRCSYSDIEKALGYDIRDRQTLSLFGDERN